MEEDESEEEGFFDDTPVFDDKASFTSMNLSRPLLKAIEELRFIHPTPIQAATIPVALLGRDICGCAATGTGKTAAYMLPVLERLLYRPKEVAVTRVLVLVPTRELGVQVGWGLKLGQGYIYIFSQESFLLTPLSKSILVKTINFYVKKVENFLIYKFSFFPQSVNR